MVAEGGFLCGCRKMVKKEFSLVRWAEFEIFAFHKKRGCRI